MDNKLMALSQPATPDPSDPVNPLLAYAGQQQPSWFSRAGQYLYDKYARSLVNAAALPGDVYAGRVDPYSDDAMNRALLLGAMNVSGGSPIRTLLTRQPQSR